MILPVFFNSAGEFPACSRASGDALLGRVPNDWDITTSASPLEVKDLFHRTVDTGLQHGTVTVMLGNEGYEVTTYRLDGDYADGRHPTEVTFTKSLREDLKRRDFTINAMAYHPEEGVVDLFDGFQPGPALGETLFQLLTMVLEEPELNTKEELLTRARALRREQTEELAERQPMG